MESEALVTPNSVDNRELNNLKRKTHFTGTVIATTLAGAVIDVGLEVPGVVHISQLQLEPVNRVEEVVQPGQIVEVWVRRVVPKKKRLELTMIKPLDLEWREIDKDLVVTGKVMRMERFGVFVDIGAERPGLVHISEMTHGYIKEPAELVKEGDQVEVKVLNVNRQKKQIKLSMKALEEIHVKPPKDSPKEQAPKSEPQAEVEPPIPTAMEMAMREAMERTRDRSEVTVVKEKRKTSTQNDELERVLARTLQQKSHIK